jgi:hypothetical protein
MDIFESKFNKYKNIRDKFDSQFTIICHNITPQELENKLTHQIELFKLVKDNFKKSYLINKLDQMKKKLDKLQEIKIINSVFFIDKEQVSEVILEEKWIQILQDYNINNYIFKQSEFFDIDFLQDLLLNEKLYDIICVTNDSMTHSQINKTKKMVIYKSKKNHDLQEYLNKNIKNICLVYSNTPNILKNIKHNNIIIINRLLNDEEIIKEIDKEINNKNMEELETWLKNILHPKLGSRIVFGKDINMMITNKLLKTLYCSQEFSEKVRTKVPEYLKVFDVIVINSNINGDIGDILKKTYSGAIGITYY